jgi:hypothetical protein
MTVKYRINCVSRDRWEGPNFWTEDFNTQKQAEARIKWYNDQNTEKMAPEYYEYAERTVEKVKV